MSNQPIQVRPDSHKKSHDMVGIQVKNDVTRTELSRGEIYPFADHEASKLVRALEAQGHKTTRVLATNPPLPFYSPGIAPLDPHWQVHSAMRRAQKYLADHDVVVVPFVGNAGFGASRYNSRYYLVYNPDKVSL